MEPRPRISAAMVARSRTVAEPRWSPSGARLAWLEAFDGRADVVVAPAGSGRPPVVVTADFPPAPAGAYGGGAFCWAGDDALVVAGADGRLAVVPAAGGPPRVLTRDGRAFAPAVAPGGILAACSVERDDACDVAVVPLDGSAWPVRVSTGGDYAWDPAWSPDGRLLAWHEWDLPGMPWDASRVAVADASDPSRAAATARVVAGGDGAAAGQPRFAPGGGALAYTSDRDGWTNVWVAAPDGRRPRPLRAEPHEHAEPSWGPGQRSFAWSPDGTHVAWCRNESGFGRLAVAPVRGRARARDVARGWHHGLDWGPGGIVAVRSGARTPSEVTVTDLDGTRRGLARGPAGGFEAAELAEPEAVTWRSGGAPVHGLLYRPARPALGPGTKPPLYVHVHGGPTSQTTAAWNARIAFWVDRGWAVLAPNYRGSTGYGRAYAAALDGRWGEADVADTAAGIRHAARRGWCDAGRVAAVGGSAGGLTVLLLTALHPGLLRAAVSLFGVTDLFDLAATTHRFESGYLDRIVGVLPGDADRYRDRSPITHAARVAVPVLLLQGGDDPVVPRAQADALAAAARGAAAPVELHVYDGEGHGFRQLATLTDELERTEAFLRKWVLRR